MSNYVVECTDQNFNSIIKGSGKPVVVDFWAEWCGPCRMIAPVVEELAQKYQDDIVFGKLDVSDHLETSSAFSVSSIPTLLFFDGNGQLVDRLVGADPSRLKQKVEALLV